MEGPATIGVGYLLHGGNWRDIHDMVRLARDLGVDYVQFRPLILFDQAQPNIQIEGDLTYFAWMERAIGRLNAYAGDSFVVADLDRFRRYRDWQGHGYATCYWSAMQTVITPNGKVWRCTNKREHADACLGDLSEESFADVWERSGGPCAVDSQCRIYCRGHNANLTLDGIMADRVHVNFI
jgi:MoaA/NifB/PqqE/SkfB family radical SAM enzyme